MGQQYSFSKLPNDAQVPQRLSFMKLPDQAQVLALRMFDNLELIAFSLLSNRTLTVAKSLNRIADINVTIGSVVTVMCGTHSSTRLTFYQNRNSPPTEFHIPNTINVEIMSTDRFEDLVWINTSLELKAWIQHIMELFHQSRLGTIAMNGDYRFSLNSIYYLLSDFKVNTLNFSNYTTTPPNIHAPSLLVPSNTLQFSGRNPFEKPTEMQKMVLQNVPDTYVFGFQNFRLDDLLSCNCKKFVAHNGHISTREIRNWLKLWGNGANSKLESMCIAFNSTDTEVDWLVRSLAQYMELTRKVCMDYVNEGADVRKGFEIWRKHRRGMAHVVVTREVEMNQVVCYVRMKVFN